MRLAPSCARSNTAKLPDPTEPLCIVLAAEDNEDTATDSQVVPRRMESRNPSRAEELVAVSPGTTAHDDDGTPYWEDDPTIEYGVEADEIGATGRGAERGPAPPHLRIGIGAKLRGRYVLENVIGVGGTAIVYRARDVRRERGAPFAYVAVKIPRGDHAPLQREFRATQTLPHPNIVRVFDLDRIGDTWFMVTELLEGEPLAAAIERYAPGPLPAPLAARVLRSCGEALAFAHERSMVHGDLKPGNVLLTGAGETRVLDFGATVPIAAEDAAQSGASAGLAATRRYASPQVLSGEPPVARDDIFSFGCLAYEVLTGTHPFGQGSSAEARQAGITLTRPSSLTVEQWQALSRALSWERADRPHSLRELLERLWPHGGSWHGTESLAAVQPRAQRTAPTPVVVSALVVLTGLAMLLAWTRFADELAAPASPVAPAAAEIVPLDAAEESMRMIAAVAGGMAAPSPADRAAAPGGQQESPQASEPRSAQPLPVSGITFDTDQIDVSEGAIAAAIVITRTRNRSGSVQVGWRTVPQTADSPGDYEEVSQGIARFADGQTRRVLYVPLRPDQIVEGEETFAVELYSESRRVQVGPISLVTVRIHDDDHGAPGEALP